MHTYIHPSLCVGVCVQGDSIFGRSGGFAYLKEKDRSHSIFVPVVQRSSGHKDNMKHLNNPNKLVFERVLPPSNYEPKKYDAQLHIPELKEQPVETGGCGDKFVGDVSNASFGDSTFAAYGIEECLWKRGKKDVETYMKNLEEMQHDLSGTKWGDFYLPGTSQPGLKWKEISKVPSFWKKIDNKALETALGNRMQNQQPLAFREEELNGFKLDKLDGSSYIVIALPEHDKKYLKPAGDIQLGLKWTRTPGAGKPKTGRELINPELAKALMGCTFFTPEQWDNLQQRFEDGPGFDLRETDFIKSGDAYFRSTDFLQDWRSDTREELLKPLKIMEAEIRAMEEHEEWGSGFADCKKWFDYVVHQPAQEQTISEGNAGVEVKQDTDNGGKMLVHFQHCSDPQTARLELHEVAALRFYTSLAFKWINNPLRRQIKPHPLALTTSYIYDGLKKLRATHLCSKAKFKSRYLWRGMKNLTVSNDFMLLGGCEPACMSTSEALSVVAGYASSMSPLLFRIKVDSPMDLGANIKWCSVYPGVCGIDGNHHHHHTHTHTHTHTHARTHARTQTRTRTHILICICVLTSTTYLTSVCAGEEEVLYPPLTFLKPMFEQSVVGKENARVITVKPSFPS